MPEMQGALMADVVKSAFRKLAERYPDLVWGYSHFAFYDIPGGGIRYAPHYMLSGWIARMGRTLGSIRLLHDDQWTRANIIKAGDCIAKNVAGIQELGSEGLKAYMIGQR